MKGTAEERREEKDMTERKSVATGREREGGREGA